MVIKLLELCLDLEQFPFVLALITKIPIAKILLIGTVDALI
jgi:hypothetical protein